MKKKLKIKIEKKKIKKEKRKYKNRPFQQLNFDQSSRGQKEIPSEQKNKENEVFSVERVDIVDEVKAYLQLQLQEEKDMTVCFDIDENEIDHEDFGGNTEVKSYMRLYSIRKYINNFNIAIEDIFFNKSCNNAMYAVNYDDIKNYFDLSELTPEEMIKKNRK